jgi:hypothetical protein
VAACANAHHGRWPAVRRDGRNFTKPRTRHDDEALHIFAFFEKDQALPEAKSGFCHRYPPTVFLIDQDFRTLFPPVRDEFSCGEHKSAAKASSRL